MSIYIHPVFIGGCGRSGTTLLGELLGRRSDCVTTPESQFVPKILHARQQDESLSIEYVVDYITKHWRFRLWGLEPDIDSLISRSSVPEVILDIIRQYGEINGRPYAKYWIDHTPGHIHHLSVLTAAFPAARIIHIVRDPRGVTASVLGLDWGPNTASGAAAWWLRHIAFGLAAELAFSGRCIRIRYEDLVADPEPVRESIEEWLGMAPTLLQERSSLKLPAYTEHQHSRISGPVNASRAVAWRSELSSAQIATVEHATRDMMPMLGYEKSGVEASPEPRTREVWRARARRLRSRVKYAARRFRGLRSAPRSGM